MDAHEWREFRISPKRVWTLKTLRGLWGFGGLLAGLGFVFVFVIWLSN